LTAGTGFILTGWALLATAQSIARISGGSYGTNRIQDFAIEHFWIWGPALLAIGTAGWIGSRLWPDPPSEEQPRRLSTPTLPMNSQCAVFVHRHEFQATDDFGWPRNVVCEQDEYESASGESRTNLSPQRIFVLGGGGLVRVPAGLYLDPATQNCIRSCDPEAPLSRASLRPLQAAASSWQGGREAGRQCPGGRLVFHDLTDRFDLELIGVSHRAHNHLHLSHSLWL